MKAMKAMKTAKLMSKGTLATELAEAAELKKSDVSKVPWPADVVGWVVWGWRRRWEVGEFT